MLQINFTEYAIFSAFCFTCLLLVTPVMAQTGSVTGTVSDADTGETIPGVNVLVAGTAIGTSTDPDGSYQINNVPAGTQTLRATFLGYADQEQEVEVVADETVTVSFELVPGAVELEEIVAIAYGEIRRRDLTGSVSSVQPERITEVPTTNVMEAIQGKVPGMDITRGSGQPGSGMNIRIRGNRSLTASNAPLFIVDGIQYSNVDDLNPADIESVEVLRDASSTAIYGSRGANGVVLITTKQAERGATEITVNSQVGAHNVYAYPDIMTGPEYVTRAREARRTEGLWDGPVDRIDEFTILPGDENILSPQDLEAIENNVWTDYRPLLLEPGIQQDYRLGVATGTENTRAYLSLNFYDEEGILELDHLRRYTGRLNVDQTISDVFSIGMNAHAAFSDHDRRREPFNMANKISPLHEAFLEDGSINVAPTDRDISPLADLAPNAYDNNEWTTRVFPSLYAEFEPSDNLRFRTNVSGTYTHSRHGIYRASETIDRAFQDPQAVYNTFKGRSITVENIATFQTGYRDHSVSMTGIQSYSHSRDEWSDTQGENQLLDTQLYYGLVNAPSGVAIDSRYQESSLASVAGRLHYDWQNRYLLTLTGRFDGSSRLAPGNQWAFFPSAAAAWRIVDEPFMQGLRSSVDELKLRLSYGVSGNEAIAPYSTQSTLTRIPMGFDNSAAPGYTFSPQVGNPDLEWELSATANLGLDLAIWSHRLNASIDIYNTNTTNLLLQRTLPTTSGVASVTQNVGETRNRGIELALGTENVVTDQFTWSTDLTFFANREEIISLVTDEDNIGNGWFIGHPTQVFYDYEKIDIWQENEAEEAAQYGQVPGQIKVRDQDNSGSITAADDRVILGSNRPSWSGGLDNRFTYGNFDLSFSLFARVGNMMDFGLYDAYKDGPAENAPRVDYWTPENPQGTFPRPGAETPYRSTINYMDASFLKLRNATLGYTLPSNISQAIAVGSMRVYVSGRNLHTWTEADNYDPERGGSASYPMTRLFIGGVDIQF